MLQPKARPTAAPTATARHAASAARGAVPRPFFGAIDAVLVEDVGEFAFDGAITRSEAQAIWTWLVRDVAPDLVDGEASPDNPATLAALEAIIPTLLSRARAAATAGSKDAETERRFKAQLGGSEVWQRLPTILAALKCAPLLDKAKAFGRAINGLPDDDALVAALQSMPRQDSGTAALLMMAAVGQVTNPARLTVPATRIAGDATETALQRAGFAPVIDACLAHAQNAIPPLLQAGAFSDVDLICRSVERFHRLIRGVAANIELSRQGRWAGVIAALTKTVSQRLEPRLREVTLDINSSLRRHRDGPDRLDSDGLLSAVSGVFLLAAVRECRDSLALNEVFDESWNRAGQALEMHLTRNLELLRTDPADQNIIKRLDAGIKMAEVRFGGEYAEVLRRARDGVERRLASG